MIRLIIKAFKKYPWFRRLNAKLTYEILAKHIRNMDWQFMNYGYMPLEEEKASDLPPVSEKQYYPMLMYHCLASKVPVQNKSVLEVGSGRGGGAYHVANFFCPQQYIGIDIAQNAVDLANASYKMPNLSFQQASAEALPFQDESFDVVVNVESCHGYGCVDTFLAEVKRVLKTSGYLLLVDFRSDFKITMFQEQIRRSGFQVIQEENISSNVIRSIEAENPTKQEAIRRLIPPRWQKLFSEFAGVVNSKFYLTLKDGSRQYYRYVLQKI